MFGVSLNVLLDDEIYERVRRAAFETWLSMSRIAVEALLRWLDEYEAQQKAD